MKFRFYRLLAALFFLSSLSLLTGCSDDEDKGKEEEIEKPAPIACLYENAITISDIDGIPDNVTFDKIKATISGTYWEVIETVETTYKQGSAVLALPATFSSEKLQPADRTDKDKYGYWPGVSSDPQAMVAALGDFIAYKGDTRVGRVFLSDWSRKGSSAGKAFIYYHFADRDYDLSGSNKSYYYNASFKKGWNAYANINPTSEETVGNILCTTSIPTETGLRWRFESWVY